MAKTLLFTISVLPKLKTGVSATETICFMNLSTNEGFARRRGCGMMLPLKLSHMSMAISAVSHYMRPSITM
jgi:hypothetical protein